MKNDGSRRFVVLMILLAASIWGQQVGSMSVTDTSGVSRTNAPLPTFSRAFADGDICSYPKPLVNGAAVSSWQTDVRVRWPSGCVKYATFALQSDLANSASSTLTFQNDTNPCNLGNQATCDAAALTESSMLAFMGGTWNAITELANTTTGALQTVDARTMVTNHSWSYLTKGPVMTRILVRDLNPDGPYAMGFSTNTGGTVIKGLMPWYIITFYNNYTAGVQIEFVLENTWTKYTMNQVYSINLKNGAGTILYTKSGVTHYFAARFHKGNPAATLWEGTRIGNVRYNHNVSYLIGAKALVNYDTSLVPDAASVVTNYNASNLGDDFGEQAKVTTNIGDTGARSDISWIQDNVLKCMMNPVAGCDAVIFTGNADVAGHIPIHFRESDTTRLLCATACTGPRATQSAYGLPINFQSRPGLNSNSITDTGGAVASSTPADRIPVIGTLTKGVWTWETGHHPSLAYGAYLLSGDYYYLEEMEYWAGTLSTSSTPVGRNYEWGLQVHINNQMRGAAWSLRTISQYAFIMDDNTAQREMYITNLLWNAEYQEGILGRLDGNFPRANANCPGYTAGLTGPISGPDRDRWCFGYMYVNRGKPNPLHSAPFYQTVNWNTDGWGRFDYKLTSTQQYAPWMLGYMLITINWIDDAIMSAYSYVIDDYTSFWAGAMTAAPKLYTLLTGGTYAYWHPSHDPNQNFFTTYAAYEAAVRVSGTTTLTSPMTTASTTMQVASVTSLLFRPAWRRCAGTCPATYSGSSNAITGVNLTAGIITVTFTNPPGLQVGDAIQSAGHTTAAFNISGTSTTVTAVTSNTISFPATGTIPADGSYFDSNYYVQTPRTNILLKVGNEYINACSFETDGTIVIDADGNTSGGTAGQAANVTQWCAASTRGRAQVASAKVAHSSGETVESAWDAWPDGPNVIGGYTWIMNAAFTGVTKRVPGGSAAWSARQTNVMSRFASYYNSSKDPIWSIKPRNLGGFMITTTGLAPATVGVSYYQRLFTSGQVGAVTWTQTSGLIPNGLSFNTATGEITGTPTASGSVSLGFSANDTATTVSTTLGLTVNGVSITINPTGAPTGTVGTAYTVTFTASGGVGSYTYTKPSGTTPPGLILTGGTLAGTPTLGGSYTFSILATDSLGNSAQKSYTISIAYLPLSITSATILPNATVGVPYTYQITYTGGSGINTWQVTAGTIPVSYYVLSGLLSGTVWVAGGSNFTMTLTDTVTGTQVSKAFVLNTLPAVDLSGIFGNISMTGTGVVVK